MLMPGQARRGGSTVSLKRYREGGSLRRGGPFRLVGCLALIVVALAACGEPASRGGQVFPTPTPEVTVSPTSSPSPEPTPSATGSPARAKAKGTREPAEEFCASRPPDTPGILHMWFAGRDDDHDWTFAQARAAMRRAGIDPDKTLPREERYWGEGQAGAALPGTTGDLLSLAQKLSAQRAPAKTLEAPDAWVSCDGHPDLDGDSFSIELPEDVDVREIVRRHGNRETIEGEPIETDRGTRWWTLGTKDPGTTVRRALLYFKDREVVLVWPELVPPEPDPVF